MRKNRLLVLVDIDGTLISPGMVPRRSITQAIQEYTGQTIHLNVEQLAGFTDPIIISNILISIGYDNIRRDGIVGKIIERYVELLEENYPGSNDKMLFLGVIPFLEFLSGEPFRVGLMTGNIRRGAYTKLSPFGIHKYFSLGVYGDDNPDRNKLPLIAVRKARESFSETFEPKKVVVIGDTVRDVWSAHNNGMKSMVVLRREQWREKIESENPELIVRSFEPLEPICEWFFTVQAH